MPPEERIGSLARPTRVGEGGTGINKYEAGDVPQAETGQRMLAAPMGVFDELATDTTRGFMYIPTIDGVPTGTPVVRRDKVPMVFRKTDGRLYIHDGTSWISVLLA